MKKNLQSIFALALTSFLGMGAAMAQETPEEGCYATSVLAFDQVGTVALDRSDADQALGQPDASNAVGGFVSLGNTGSITLGFDGAVFDLDGNDLRIFETSFSGDNCGFGDDESADIEVSNGGEYIYVGTICRDGEVDIAISGLDYITAVRITSTDDTQTSDGYDVDGIEAINGCGSIPSEEEGCYGGDVLEFSPGLTNAGLAITDPNRIDPNQATDAPELDNTYNFVSLGYGGYIILGFDGGAAFNGPGDDLLVAETTFGNNDFTTFPESADVYVSQNGATFFLLGSVTTSQAATFDIDAAGQGFSYIVAVKIVDTTPESSVSEDAFDVDGIEALNGCGSIPVIEGGNCNATEVISYTQGTRMNGNPLALNRTDENMALGEPEGTDAMVFVTLGYNGSIILGFDGSVPNEEGPDLEIVETSFGTEGCASYMEYADVSVSVDGLTWYAAGTVCKSENLVDISDAGDLDFINYVMIENNDIESMTSDGYDLDGVFAIHNCLGPDPEILNPFCTNETVITAHTATSEIVRLTAMGNYLENGLYGYRWRIRNETGMPQTVTYNFAGAPEMQGPFVLGAEEQVFFTSGFGTVINGGGTMRIFDEEGVQWQVKAHGGDVTDLANCGDGPQIADNVAASTSLSSFPNPAIDDVAIVFTPATAERATVEIYDMNGRPVATVFNQEVQAGSEYRVDFDGSNLTNGVYLARFITSSEVITHKILIAR